MISPNPDTHNTDLRMRMNDRNVDQIVGRLLQWGVIIAAAVLVVGFVTFLVGHGHQPADFDTFRGEPQHLTALSGIVRGVRTLDAPSIIQLGLVLLIATPVARVALTLIAFLIQRDRVYVLLSGAVLGILLYGLLGGRV